MINFVRLTAAEFIELVDAATADAPKWAIEKAAELRKQAKDTVDIYHD